MPENMTVSDVILLVALVLAFVVLSSGLALYVINASSRRLAELVPPSIADAIAGIATDLLDVLKRDAATRALEIADRTVYTWDDELARTVISGAYTIEQGPDGKYVLTPKDAPGDEPAQG